MTILKKKIRILTIKHPDKKSYESIEFNGETLFWVGGDYTGSIIPKDLQNKIYIQCFLENRPTSYSECYFSFPCDVNFVSDKFKEAGRIFDQTKLVGLKYPFPYGKY